MLEHARHQRWRHELDASAPRRIVVLSAFLVCFGVQVWNGIFTWATSVQATRSKMSGGTVLPRLVETHKKTTRSATAVTRPLDRRIPALWPVPRRARRQIDVVQIVALPSL